MPYQRSQCRMNTATGCADICCWVAHLQSAETMM
jgi:hypothetical protein